MADESPSSTLRQRRPGTAKEDVTAPEPEARDKAKAEKGASSGLVGVLFLVLALLGFGALSLGAGAGLWYWNPNDYFRPTPKPPWFSSPDPLGSWEVDFSADSAKRGQIVDAFRYAWAAYERDAMGCDEYHPVARRGSNLTDKGGIGYMVVDALDTMMLMGLADEYKKARDWIATSLNFEKDAEVSLFETTIRILGGLLSAYHLATLAPQHPTPHPFIAPGDAALFLSHARDLGERLLVGGFRGSPSGLPFSFVNLKTRQGFADRDNRGMVSTAEAATLQLEFRYLSYLLEEEGEDLLEDGGREWPEPEEYWTKAENVMRVIYGARRDGGLAPIFMSMDAGQFVASPIRLGSRGDSYYEYLLKQHLQTSLAEPVYAEMYRAAMNAVHSALLVRGPNTGKLYTQEIQPRRNAMGEGVSGKGGVGVSWVKVRKQDHLVCFLPGELLLGAVTVGRKAMDDGAAVSVPPKEDELTEDGRRDWSAAIELVETCAGTYRTKTGLSPEIVHIREDIEKATKKTQESVEDWFIKGEREPGSEDGPVYDARYILRPETVESLLIAWRLTGNPRYRTHAWRIFRAIERHCRVPGGSGYAGVLDVQDGRQPPSERNPDGTWLSEEDAQWAQNKWEDKMETFLLGETFKYLWLMFADGDVLALDKYVFNTEAHPLPIFSPPRHRL